MARAKWIGVQWFYKDDVLRDTARAYLQEIFLERLHREEGSECWWFLDGEAVGRGYKYISWQGRGLMAHRFAYELFIGEIPDGLLVLHSCDTPPCVNPAHLRIGTHAENVKDLYSRGRHRTNGFDKRDHCPQGHEYTTENTYLFENRRYCRSCHKEHSSAHARKMQREQPELKRQKLRDWRASKKHPIQLPNYSALED